MTYLQLLRSYGAPANHKVYVLVGGEARLREDALRVLHRRIKNTLGREVLRAWYHLDEIKAAPLEILHESIFDIRTIMWQPDLVAEDVAKTLLKELSVLSGYSIIVDASSEVLPYFTAVYKKFGKGAMVDCSKKPSVELIQGQKFGGFVTARLKVAGVKLPEIPTLLDLTSKDMTVDTLFNIFSVLEALGEREVRGAFLRQLGLLRRSPETFLVEKLFSQGKQEVLRYSFREVDSKKFFKRLYWGLILRLRVKSTKFMKATIASSKLNISLHHYCEYQKELKKIDYRDLYRRLYLVFSLLRWSSRPESVYLALLYW